MCHVLANKCFKDDTHMTGYTVNEINDNSDNYDDELPVLLEKHPSFSCSFQHKNNEIINFTFTVFQNSENAHVILFNEYNRYDNQSENKLIKVLAVIPAYEVHNYYNILFKIN